MTETTVQWGSLVVVALAAFAVPLILRLIPGAPIPLLVGEVTSGIVLGKSGLGWIKQGPWLDFLFLFGLAFLLFVAGLEIDFDLLRRSLAGGARDALRSPLLLAIGGFSIRLALAFAVTVPLTALGLLSSPTLVGFLLTSTSLGVVLSVLKERELLGQPFGQMLIVAAGVADFGTVLLLTIFFSAGSHSKGVQVALVVSIIALGLGILVGLRTVIRVPRAAAVVETMGGATAQILIRGSFALLLGLVALAEHLGVEVILGAFVAGAVVSALSLKKSDPLYQGKIDAIGFGFFVPVFFILTGARIDIPALVRSGSSLALLAVLLPAAFVVKTIPAGLYRLQRYRTRECFAAGVLQSAQLTFTVAGVEIGLQLGLLTEAVASALLLMALFSVLLAPLAFARLFAATEAAGRMRGFPQPRSEPVLMPMREP